MAHENKILHISLFVGLVSILAGGVADGAVRIGNKTKNDAYRQVIAANNAVMDSYAVTVAEPELPVRVANDDLAQEIKSGAASAVATQLPACAKIYPNGEFAWDKPTAGIGAGGATTCVAVVELRGYQMGPGGSDVVLARANVAAGSTVKCNISDLPESSYTIDAQNVLFPADSEPTMVDVVRVMNQEQKQNAALKIAAGTLIGGLGGNIAGANDIGKDSLMGTDKGKMRGTLIGALGGAAITAGSVYAGKVGGDMILSTGINAAAGGVVGNIASSGDSVLRIEDCKQADSGSTSKCLWGYVVQGDAITDKDNAYYNLNTGSAVVCTEDKCTQEHLASIKVDVVGEGKSEDIKEILSLKREDMDALKGRLNVTFWMQTENGKTKMVNGSNAEEHIYVKIYSAKRATSQKPALIVGIQDKFFGMKRSDWYKWKNDHANNEIHWRGTRGEIEGVIPDASLNDFEPMYVSAEDGGIIDLDNKARLPGTMIGAGAGGALGAFVGYQGAQSDIDARWVAAVREYKDSLQKFYCATGTRFLSYYNEPVMIPNMNE